MSMPSISSTASRPGARTTAGPRNKVNGKIAFYACIGCIGHHQGSPSAYSCNAITSHDGGRSLSINGTYWGCQGGQSAHVIANTQHWSIGDAIHSGLTDVPFGGTAPPADWLADQGNASIWVDSGQSAPGSTASAGYYSLYTDATGGSDTANIYYRNCNLAGAIGANCIAY